MNCYPRWLSGCSWLRCGWLLAALFVVVAIRPTAPLAQAQDRRFPAGRTAHPTMHRAPREYLIRVAQAPATSNSSGTANVNAGQTEAPQNSPQSANLLKSIQELSARAAAIQQAQQQFQTPGTQSAAGQPVLEAATEQVPATNQAPGGNGAGQFTIPVQSPAERTELDVKANEGKVTIAATNADLKDILSLLARSQGLNLVCGQDVTASVTVSLDRVPVETALNSILSVGGFVWSIHQDVIHVTNAVGENKLAASVQGRVVRVFDLDYASAADVDAAIKGLLSPIGQSFVSEPTPTDNRRTRDIIVVEDLPANLARIEQYVSQVDQPPRQVLIEVYVMQVDLDDSLRHGVNFQHLANMSGNSLSIQTTGLATATAPQAFFLQLSGGNLTGLLEALKSTNDTKTLASPRIHALNGQESKLQVGAQLGFRVTTTTETSTLESVEFLDVGVVLSVTPRITRSGHVLMKVKPEVSTGQVNSDTGLPEEETTEVQTDVLLASGQGIVIGGLIQEKDIETQNKLPILGDLNLFGPLFQRRAVTKERNEIVIALVPHIVPLRPDVAAAQQEKFDLSRSHLVQPCRPIYEGPKSMLEHDAYRNPIRLPRPRRLLPNHYHPAVGANHRVADSVPAPHPVDVNRIHTMQPMNGRQQPLPHQHSIQGLPTAASGHDQPLAPQPETIIPLPAVHARPMPPHIPPVNQPAVNPTGNRAPQANRFSPPRQQPLTKPRMYYQAQRYQPTRYSGPRR